MPHKKNIITRFLIWKYKHLTERQFLYILSFITGLLAGISAVILKNITHSIQQLLEGNLISKIHEGFYFIFPFIGLYLTYLVIKKVIKRPISHGIPSTLFAISKREGIIRRSQIWTSTITAPLTVGFGGSVGLEGPTVATGSAVGSNIARLFHLDHKSRILLIACAAAGAMVSVFKAPITAIVFALEIFSLELTMASMIPLLLASIAAVLTSYFFLVDDLLLHFKIKDSFNFKDVIFYVLLGVISAFISIYFSKVYFISEKIFDKIKKTYIKLIIGGGLIGIIVYMIPPLFGEGFSTINSALRGNLSPLLTNNYFDINTQEFSHIFLLLLGLILFKVIAMTLTFGAGGVGGVFAPTLFIGSITGYLVAITVNHFELLSNPVSLSNFAMVGMAGMMAGNLQAPLTAIFLIAEITGGYELFVPLMIVSAISYMIAKKYIPHSIYNAALAKKGQLMTHDKDKNVLMLMNIDKVIETDFISIKPETTLGEMVKNAIVKSNRNNFPVVDMNTNLIGVVHLDDIRAIMFNTELYETTTIEEYMNTPPEIIHYEKDDMGTIMDKFKTTAAWNLPVIKNGKYHGFISKSRLMSAYRRTLIQASDTMV